MPRNMPVLLVLEICEHGTLLDHVQSPEEPGLDATRLLSYCHDVGRALTYLSARKIVHRDVAARNVLLDSALNCKLSDFGMSVVLNTDDSEYASSYVRIKGGEAPIRWSAIEVLTENKFSTASASIMFLFACSFLL